MFKVQKRVEHVRSRSKAPRQTNIVNISKEVHFWSFIPCWIINPGQRLQASQRGFIPLDATSHLLYSYLNFRALTWAPAMLQSTSLWFIYQVKKSNFCSGLSTMVYNSFLTQIQVISVSANIIQGWYTAGIGTIGQGHLLTIPDALQHSNIIAQVHPLCNLRTAITNCVPLAGSHFPSATTVKLIPVGYYPGQDCAKNSPEPHCFTSPSSVPSIFLALKPNPSTDDKSNKKPQFPAMKPLHSPLCSKWLLWGGNTWYN